MTVNYLQDVTFASGSIADLRLGWIAGTKKIQVVVKKARLSYDNDLLEREATTLNVVRMKMSNSTESPWKTTIPQVFASQVVLQGSNSPVRVNVLEAFHGFFSAEDILKMAGGVDTRTIAWMWKRLLGLLEWVHKSGYVHGAVLPPHVLYFPDNNLRIGRDIRKHAVRLVDWCYSVPISQTKLTAWVPEYEAFYPPEVFNKRGLSVATDLYMGAKTMLYLMGGDVFTDRFPDGVSPAILSSFQYCLDKDITRRERSAAKQLERFVGALKSTYGEPQFHHFILPGI
jgi:serine/threonine protein kinase